ADRTSSENRSVANWCNEPFAFSTVNVTRPRRPSGLKSSLAGTGTGAGRGEPPHAAAEHNVRSARVLYTVTCTGRLRMRGEAKVMKLGRKEVRSAGTAPAPPRRSPIAGPTATLAGIRARSAP